MRKKHSITAHIFEEAEKGKGLFVLGVLASVIGMLCNTVPYLSVYAIGKIFLTGTFGNGKAVLFWIAVAGAAIVCNLLFTFLGSLSCHKVAFTALYRYRIKLMEHLGKVPIGFFSTHTSGGIQKIADENIEKLEAVIAHMIPDMTGSLAVLAVMFFGIGYLNIFLALTVLFSVIAAFCFQFMIFGGEKAKRIYTDFAKSSMSITAAFSEFIRGIADVKIFGKASGMTADLEKHIDGYLFWEISGYKRSAFFMSMYKSISLSILTFVLPVGGLLIVFQPSGETVLSVLTALIIAPALYEPLLTFVDYATQISMIQAGGKQIEEIMNAPLLEVKEDSTSAENNSVEFKNVSFSYQGETEKVQRQALNGVSFSCKEGEMTALVGESGSGKSTVGQLLLRFWDIHHGSITIGGKDIRSINTTELMDKIAFVFQETYIFADTVKNNITMSRSVSEAELIAAAKKACCHDFIQSLPQGYDTVIGSGSIRLSGGEAQRISIARAFLKDSPIVILDEALAYTDAENENLIQEAIKNLIHNKTLIVIAHRLQSIMEADKIIVLKNGSIIEEGTHKDLMSGNTEYKTLWDLQHEADIWELSALGEKR